MGVLFAIVVACSWAAYNIAVRRGMQYMRTGPGYLVTMAVGLVANTIVLFLPFPGHGTKPPSLLPVLFFILGGFATTLLARWVYFVSIETIGPSRASAWKNAAPIYTLLLSAIFLGERVDVQGAIGTLTATAGLLLLSRESRKSAVNQVDRAAMRLGIITGFACGFFFTVGMILRKAGLNIWPDPAAGTFLGALAALAVYLPYAAMRGELKEALRGPAAGIGWFALAGVLSGNALIFTFLALNVTATATAHVVSSIEPLITMGFSALFLSQIEHRSKGLLWSAGVVCLGVILVAIR